MRSLINLLVCGACYCVTVNASAVEAPRAVEAPVIDGDPGDPAWSQSGWHELKHLMLGSQPTADDFRGRYKVAWTPEYLYVLAEIVDDVLIDSHPDPLQFYWEDDALEVLIDEDASGGIHQFNYNAFAYHIALDNQVVDIAPFRTDTDRVEGNFNVRTYPRHVKAAWRRDLKEPHKLYWEVRIAVYDDSYSDPVTTSGTPAKPVVLAAGKKLGFIVAYCDADSPAGREHFMGDVEIEPVNGDRNRAYIDAGVFGELTLTEQ